MSGLHPAAMYGLKVPPGGILIPAANGDISAMFRITMAAIDPSAEPIVEENVNDPKVPRATLKVIRQPLDMDLDEDDSDDEDYDEDDEDDESSDDEEKNGGPSDPSKTVKARLAKQLEDEIAGSDSDEDMDMNTHCINGTLSKMKGKGRATTDDEDSEEVDAEELGLEQFVLCTLDPSKNWQQPLDLTFGEHEQVFFAVSGTHVVYLTGNYVIPHNDEEDDYDSDEDELDYNLPPDEDELDEEESEDELDGLADPRVTEADSEEEQVTIKPVKKGKNKRTADESEDEAALDDLMVKALKTEKTKVDGEQKLSKKQLKKLKKNNGEAAAVEAAKGSKEAAPKSDKKVQFAKNLEQKEPTKKEPKKDAAAESKRDAKAKKENVWVVNGLTIDEKKSGEGPKAKKGDKLRMRYIGKLQKDGKVFDSNKKGPAFSMKLGTGEVIKGWDIGLQGMQIGGERRLTIPAKLGYGNQKMPGIPPNSDLVFDVKLLSIN
ncbi:MAG: peptidylprolyl isomerase fpr4 [Cirrosporium novae-zelandiae]|nr:MAG: peptidylprolyl isomerase fpr4 [Cirrosporium novae-zelandiae]